MKKKKKILQQKMWIQVLVLPFPSREILSPFLNLYKMNFIHLLNKGNPWLSSSILTWYLRLKKDNGRDLKYNVECEINPFIQQTLLEINVAFSKHYLTKMN